MRYDARALSDDPFMRTVERHNDSVVIELTREDLAILANAVNEICNGPEAIEEQEFRTRIGVSRQEAVALLDALYGLS